MGNKNAKGSCCCPCLCVCIGGGCCISPLFCGNNCDYRGYHDVPIPADDRGIDTCCCFPFFVAFWRGAFVAGGLGAGIRGVGDACTDLHRFAAAALLVQELSRPSRSLWAALGLPATLWTLVVACDIIYVINYFCRSKPPVGYVVFQYRLTQHIGFTIWDSITNVFESIRKHANTGKNVKKCMFHRLVYIIHSQFIVC